ncbi:MAG TPA: DUF2911 domain-containing protein [Candidatus Binatia bacterium]|nr:DUF2911 domain-containing protein [Candidatus Binatia bacterium]
MKRALLCTALAALLVSSASAELTLPRVSQKASVMQTVGLTDVTIMYNRPGVKGRVIWGGLVPYDKVWRTGANEATTITLSQAVKINGQPLPAGTYSFHTIPGKTSWTLIFNKTAEQWGSYDYDASKDALRIQVTPVTGPNQEWMAFSFSDVSTDSATVELAWEKLRVPFKIEADTKTQAMASIDKALSGEVKDWEDPYSAASYAFNANLGNANAMKWIDQSISLKETYWNLRLKAAILEKDGKRKEAIALGEKAIEVGKQAKDDAGEISKTEKQVAEWKAATGR